MSNAKQGIFTEGNNNETMELPTNANLKNKFKNAERKIWKPRTFCHEGAQKITKSPKKIEGQNNDTARRICCSDLGVRLWFHGARPDLNSRSIFPQRLVSNLEQYHRN